jgi:hypothetical protein
MGPGHPGRSPKLAEDGVFVKLVRKNPTRNRYCRNGGLLLEIIVRMVEAVP